MDDNRQYVFIHLLHDVQKSSNLDSFSSSHSIRAGMNNNHPMLDNFGYSFPNLDDSSHLFVDDVSNFG